MMHNETRELLVKGYAKRDRKRKLGEEDLRRIDEAIAMQADITIHELTEKLQLPASEETVRRAVIEMGCRMKKKMIHASEQERPRCPGETAAMGRRRMLRSVEA